VSNQDDTKNEHINQLKNETGKLTWKELERHFARGVVIKVAIELDLVTIAAAFAEDNKAQVEDWLASGEITRANEDDARRWNAATNTGKNNDKNNDNLAFWAIVSAPWVLIQEITQQ